MVLMRKDTILIKVVDCLPHLELIVKLQPVSFIVIDKRNRGKEREIEERNNQRDGNLILVFSSLFHSRASSRNLCLTNLDLYYSN